MVLGFRVRKRNITLLLTAVAYRSRVTLAEIIKHNFLPETTIIHAR